VAFLPLVLASWTALAVHPDSLSRSKLVLHGSEASLEIRFQTLSLIEVEPGLDRDRDGLFSQEELDFARDAIGGYLAGRYLLFQGGTELEGGLASLAFAESPDGTQGFPAGFQWLEARLAFHAERAIESFEIDCRLFQEASPFHRDLTTVLFGDDAPVQHVFTADAPRWPFDPANVRRPGVFGLFLHLGIDHILGGYDHLAFLLALLLAVGRWRGLLVVVTAFTVAHSITLAFAALNPGGLLDRIPDRFVELAIALSIAYVASGNLFLKEPHTPWLEAFGFGLLHGLGFASFLGEALAGEPLVVTALFGFNLGVELGQLLVVGALALLLLPLSLWTRRASRASEGATVGQAPVENEKAAQSKAVGLAPRWMRLSLSSVVTLLALYWFAQRAGWVG